MARVLDKGDNLCCQIINLQPLPDYFIRLALSYPEERVVKKMDIKVLSSGEDLGEAAKLCRQLINLAPKT
jgi:hypothetical protein